MADNPRVLTLDEVLEKSREGQYVWIELKDDEGRLFHLQIDWITPLEHGECEFSLFMPGCIQYDVQTFGYGKEWRMWDAQASWDDMEGVAWDD